MPLTDTITDETGLAALWPAWEALWRRVPQAWPFTAPAWLQPWWQTFGTGAPVVTVMHCRGEMIGLLPLYRLGDKLLPMGVGLSDYFDILLAPSAPADAVDTLLAAALRASDAPRCDMPELPVNARLLRAATPDGWYDTRWSSSACPVLELSPQPAIPKGRRRDLNQARHRADRAGGWRVERADEASLPALLETLMDLHTNRWRAEGEPGVFADPRVAAFHRVAAPRLLQAGLLRMQALHLKARVAAIIYALVTADRIGFYLSAFDPAASFESPGMLLLGTMLDETARERRREAHFLRGDEAYKYTWGAVDQRNTGRSFIRV